MKHAKYSIITLIFLFCYTSCKKDFLNVPNKAALVREVYVTDFKTMGEFLNGAYFKLASGFYTGLFIVYGDLVADNVNPATGSIYFGAHYPWNQQSTDGAVNLEAGRSAANLNAIWNNGYKIIRDCSFILENIGKYEKEDPAKADNMRGQAYALRALVHFALVNAFAQTYIFTSDGSHPGIPYVTTSDWTEHVTRQSVAEVYNSVIIDLNKSVALLSPGAIVDARFMNRNAVEALLARVHFFKGEYLPAKNYARQVLTNVPLMINTPSNRKYPDSLFCKGESEGLFQLYPDLTYGATYFPGVYFKFSLMVATSDIAAILKEQPNDLRRYWVVNSSGKWSVSKFPEGKIGGISLPATAYYHTLLRSSEMYLISAEAYAKLGQEDSARFYLDKIRQRADVTAPNSMASGQALLDSIYKERRKEFAFEGMRMYDLQRLKKDVNRTDALNSTAQILPFGSNKAIAPIPREDVLIAGLQQNPDY